MSEQPQPTYLMVRDETGQLWAISVRPDGQLQTQQWPGGEPLTPSQHLDREISAHFPRIFAQVMDRMSPDLYPTETLKALGIEGEDTALHE